MKSRGRVPAAAKAVVIKGGFGKRPPPPPELTPRQAGIWKEIVASEHPAYFDTAALRALLAALCQRRSSADDISGVIDTFDPRWLKTNDGVKQYKRLLNMRDLETRGVTSLATKLRLTNQARYRPQAAASAARNAPKGPRPWEL